MPQAFISHSLEDSLFAQQIASGLREAGIEVWIAPDSIRPGEEFVDAIQRGLTHTTHFVLVMSPEAFISQWVKLEMNTAIRMEREGRMAITPINYRQCQPPLLLGNYQWMDYKNDATALIQRLIAWIAPEGIEGEARPQKKRAHWSEPRSLTDAQASQVQQVLDEVASEVAVCTLCPLHLNRRMTVPGAGHPGAQLMFIGEAPGPEDDKTGMPFVSPAGQLLDELLSLIRLPRSHTWMTNIVKCRPPKKNGKNQPPTPNEVATCCDTYLDRQIEAINPRIIVTLGNHALNRIAPDLPIKLSTHHGKPQRIGDRILFPMYHPAAGIYESKYKSMLMQDFVDMDRYLAALPS